MIIATFYRLELSSGRDNRRKLFNGPDDRHARGYQRPWDSYMYHPVSHLTTHLLLECEADCNCSLWAGGGLGACMY